MDFLLFLYAVHVYEIQRVYVSSRFYNKFTERIFWLKIFDVTLRAKSRNLFLGVEGPMRSM